MSSFLRTVGQKKLGNAVNTFALLNVSTARLDCAERTGRRARATASLIRDGTHVAGGLPSARMPRSDGAPTARETFHRPRAVTGPIPAGLSGRELDH